MFFDSLLTISFPQRESRMNQTQLHFVHAQGRCISSAEREPRVIRKQLNVVDEMCSAVSPADREHRMKQTQLHLVDAQGSAVSSTVKSAVEVVFRWVLRDFPHVDPAMIAEWAEEVGCAMESKGNQIVAHERYAYTALKGKVRDWLRTKTAQEESAGIGQDLERLGGVDRSFQRELDRKLLFEQLKTALNERDRYILVLLLQDETSPAVIATALGLSYPAAAKAIQRVKERIAASLVGVSGRNDFGHGSPQFCETKG
jgi:RNA polymerase sigma factor (sigma-70 family)